MDLSLHFQAHIEKKGTWSGPEGPIPLFRLHRRRLGRAMPALRPVRTVPCTGRPAAEFTVRVPAPGWLATVNASSTLGSIATVVSYPPDRQLNFPLHITRTALVLLSADAVEATLGNVPSSPPRAARHKLPSRAAPNQIKRPAYRTTRQRSEDTRTKPHRGVSQGRGSGSRATAQGRHASFSPFFPPPYTPSHTSTRTHANSRRCCLVAAMIHPLDRLLLFLFASRPIAHRSELLAPHHLI
jgi:hypothetical protein